MDGKTALLTAVLSLAATACAPLPLTYGNGSYAVGTGNGIAGAWQGGVSGFEGANQVSIFSNLSINQDSMGNLTGSWSGSDGSSGNISGTASGMSASPFTVYLSSGPCVGSISGSASSDGTYLSGTLTGQTNCGQTNLSLNLQSG